MALPCRRRRRRRLPPSIPCGSARPPRPSAPAKPPTLPRSPRSRARSTASCRTRSAEPHVGPPAASGPDARPLTDAGPVLLGCGRADAQSQAPPDWRTLPAHRDEHQVQLDVNRSFIYYPRGTPRPATIAPHPCCPPPPPWPPLRHRPDPPDQSPKQLDRRKAELSDLITEVLRRHPALCYFQGYHDICQVLLLVLGKDAAAPAVARLSLLRIRDFMLPSLAPALAQLRLLPAILAPSTPGCARTSRRRSRSSR